MLKWDQKDETNVNHQLGLKMQNDLQAKRKVDMFSILSRLLELILWPNKIMPTRGSEHNISAF